MSNFVFFFLVYFTRGKVIISLVSATYRHIKTSLSAAFKYRSYFTSVKRTHFSHIFPWAITFPITTGACLFCYRSFIKYTNSHPITSCAVNACPIWYKFCNNLCAVQTNFMLVPLCACGKSCTTPQVDCVKPLLTIFPHAIFYVYFTTPVRNSQVCRMMQRLSLGESVLSNAYATHWMVSKLGA